MRYLKKKTVGIIRPFYHENARCKRRKSTDKYFVYTKPTESVINSHRAILSVSIIDASRVQTLFFDREIDVFFLLLPSKSVFQRLVDSLGRPVIYVYSIII